MDRGGIGRDDDEAVGPGSQRAKDGVIGRPIVRVEAVTDRNERAHGALEQFGAAPIDRVSELLRQSPALVRNRRHDSPLDWLVPENRR